MNNIQNMQIFFEDFFSVNMEADQKSEKVQHYPVACEKPIKKDSDYDRQISRVDATTITLKPNNNLDICHQEDWNFPEISFTVRELREHLEKYLGTENRKVEGWILGGAANPACLPYNDIDLGFYIPNADYNTIDRLIMEFIHTKLIEKRPSHTGYYPIDKAFMIYKVYYSGRTIFKDQAGAFYGLQGLQIKIFDTPHFHCVGPADGAQASPSRRMLRFATGKDFAVTDKQFYDALSACQNKVYDVLDLHGQRDLIFRLIFKQTAGHRIKPELFNLAMQQLHVQLQGEFKEKQDKGFAKRTFNKIDAQQSPAVQPALTMLELLAAKLKNHQHNHYGSVPGKIIDFLNFMAVLHPVNQRELAQAWLDKAETLGLKEINSFAGLIVKCPEMTPYLLAFIRGVFFCEWAHQTEGQKGRLFAFERGLPPVREVVEDKIRSELGMTPVDPLGRHIALREDGHTYYLSLPEHGSPVQVASDLLNALPKLQKMLTEHAPDMGLGGLKQVFLQFKFSEAYVSQEPESYIGNRLLTAFDAPHVQETIKQHFKNHGDPKTVISQLRGHLKDPVDLARHAHKMATLSIEQCQAYSKIIHDLKPCCQLILKYARKEYNKPSTSDLNQLISLSDRIFNNQIGKDTNFLTFFKSNFAFLLPGIIQDLLTFNDEAVFVCIKKLYEAAVRNGLLASGQDVGILEQILKISKQYPASHDRFAREWEIRVSASALERGILTDKDAFVSHLQRLIQSKNPQYLLYLHRYVNRLLSFKDVPRGTVCNVLAELLSASLEYEIPSLDKQCFATLLKLYHQDEKLFGVFLATQGTALMAKLENAVVRLAGGDPSVFDALAVIFSSGKKVGEPQRLLSLFRAQFLHFPTLCTLHQAGSMAQTAIKLLQNGIKLDSTMLQQCLERLALPLLAATQHKADAASFKALGENLLGLLFQADKDKSWQRLIRQRLMLRMANAVAKQSGFIRAQEQLENFLKGLKITRENRNDSIHDLFVQFETLLKGDFADTQSLRAKVLLQMARKLDATLLEQESFQRLVPFEERQNEDASAATQSRTIRARSPVEEAIRAADMLRNLLNTLKEDRLAKVYSLSRRIMDVLADFAKHAAADAKDVAGLRASLSNTIIGMAASSKINTIRLAKGLFDSAMAVKLFDSKQEGLILIELFKGHVVVESLHPEMPFKKDTQNYFEQILKLLPLDEKHLGIEGCLAMLNMAEKLMADSTHGHELAAQVINKMLAQPVESSIVRIRLMNIGLKLASIQCRSESSKDYERGTKLFFELCSGQIPKNKKLISSLEKCLLALTGNQAFMKDEKGSERTMNRVFSLLFPQSIFDHFSPKTTTALMKALLCTNNSNTLSFTIQAVLLVPEWGNGDNPIAYEKLMQYLMEICQDGDQTVLKSVANAFRLFQEPASKVLSRINRQDIVNDCLICIYSRSKNIDMLLAACDCFNKQTVTSRPRAIHYLLKGISELEGKEYSAIIMSIFDTLLQQCLDIIAKCPQEEVNLISDPIMDLFIRYLNIINFMELSKYNLANGINVDDRKLLADFGDGVGVFFQFEFSRMVSSFYKDYFDALKLHGKVSYNCEKLILCQMGWCKDNTGGWIIADVLQVYHDMKKLYDKETLKCLQVHVEEVLKDRHRDILDFDFVPLAHIRQKNQQSLKKLGEQVTIMEKMLFNTLPLYEICAPELGRQAVEFVIEKLASYVMVGSIPEFLYDWLRRCKKSKIFASKRMGFFQVSPLNEQEQLQVNKQYLRIYHRAMKSHMENAHILCMHLSLLRKELYEFNQLVKKLKEDALYSAVDEMQVSIFAGAFVNAITLNQKADFYDHLDKFEQEIIEMTKDKELWSTCSTTVSCLPNFSLYVLVLRAIIQEGKGHAASQDKFAESLLNKDSIYSLLAQAKILNREPFNQLPRMNIDLIAQNLCPFIPFIVKNKALFQILTQECMNKVFDITLDIMDKYGKYYFVLKGGLSDSFVSLTVIFKSCLKGKEKDAYLNKLDVIYKRHRGMAIDSAKTSAEEDKKAQQEKKGVKAQANAQSRSKAKKFKNKKKKS